MSNFLRAKLLFGGLMLLLNAPARAQNLQSVPLIPYRDPWPLAVPRFQDIANRTFNAWFDPVQRRSNGKFQYSAKQVVLSYQNRPGGAQFQGRLTARGLKPNFCYQMKLVGKPQSGARGWGAFGDDIGNERIGRAGRWWDDQSNAALTNISDFQFQQLYLDRPAATRHTIYGYLYIGAFVTDKNGNFSGPIEAKNSFHVTWQAWQLPQDPESATIDGAYQNAGSWQLPGNGGYGYGALELPIQLFYEFEAGRAQPLKLPPGDYNCRFLLTEESFHNQSATTPEGGTWQSVLCSEDFALDAAGNLAPDANPANDIRFTIR